MATQRRGWIFWAFLIPCLYVLLSAAIAIATVDKCGDEDAEKSWQFVPPQWECEEILIERPPARP